MGSDPAYQSPDQGRPLESKDWEQISAFKGLPVQLLINWTGASPDAFIVFINDRGDVDYKTIGKYDQIIESPECGAILNQIETLEAVPIEHLAQQTKLDFRAMLGASLARALSDDQKNAASLINEAKQFVSARNQELARRWFLEAALCATIVTVIFSALCWVFRSLFIFLMGTDFMPLVIVWAAGASGALFSVLTRTTNIQVDPAAGRALHYLEGTARIIAGIIAATFVYLAMTTGVIATKLVGYNLGGEALLCMVAGASERFVRTIIKKVDIVGNDRGEEEK
ncbi:MAG: hypothetical protein JRN15_24485 [Nitrososphaerota archaeon]|nr:hypothetical protein [Nitrososphaerota archaeon]